jgi:hypothetical protein
MRLSDNAQRQSTNVASLIHLLMQYQETSKKLKALWLPAE